MVVALVSPEDFDLLDQEWVIWKGYVINKNHRHTLHSAVWERMGYAKPGPGFCIDHVDRDPTNCTRENLRLATVSQNNANRDLPRGASGYVGVYFDRQRGKYRAHIQVEGRKIHLGYFDKPREAAHERDNAARLYFGEFAVLNFGG